MRDKREGEGGEKEMEVGRDCGKKKTKSRKRVEGW